MTARLPEFGRFAVWCSKPPRLVIADDRPMSVRPEVCPMVGQTYRRARFPVCVTVAQTSRRGAAITAPAPPRSGATTAQTLSRRQRPPPTTDHPPPVADRQPIVAEVCESTQLTISRRMSLRHNAFSCRCEGGDSFARAYTSERGRGRMSASFMPWRTILHARYGETISTLSTSSQSHLTISCIYQTTNLPQ